MEELKIAVTGLQFGDPINFIEFLENEFNLQRKITLFKTDRMAFVQVPKYQDKKLNVYSIVPAIWHEEEIHELLLKDCDGILLFHSTKREREQAMEESLNKVGKWYEKICPQASVVTVFNNFVSFTERSLEEFLSFDEMRKYTFPNSPMFETNLRILKCPKVEESIFSLSNLSNILKEKSSLIVPNYKFTVYSKEGGYEILNCLLDLIDKKTK